MMPRPWYSRIVVLLLLALPLLALGGRILPYFTDPALEIYNAPATFTRRNLDFTLNVTGRLGAGHEGIQYRVNDGPWRPYSFLRPYADEPFFTIQIPRGLVVPGKNRLTLKAGGWFGSESRKDLEFSYSDAIPQLPITCDWSKDGLQAAHGGWERVQVDGKWFARVKPGTEGYDRILVLTGAFPGDRRIETRVHFSTAPAKGLHYGFGVLPLWGGRPDREGQVPRRGWEFSLAWYYSHRLGVGQEFSYKEADGEPDWLGSYRNYQMREDSWHNIVVEVWRELDDQGRFVQWVQRMKWWQDGEEVPKVWRKLEDSLPRPLDDHEYGVGFVAHRCSIDVGETRILPLHRGK